MSKVEDKDLVWYPAAFPAQGRLPDSTASVGENCKKQESHESAYRQELCNSAGRRVMPPCCKTLHISLFFDGTGNNLNNDLYLSDPKHPTNIARLFRATIGKGYAGGVNSNQGALFDTTTSTGDNYFKFYVPGVGTPFPEVNDLDYSMPGLAFAKMGEDRINWALLRIIDVLKRVLPIARGSGVKLTETESRAAIADMAANWSKLGFGASHNRYEVFRKKLTTLKPLIKPALEQPEPGKPKLLGIKLYVYGFSRGAAAARTFVRWLSELLPPPEEGKDQPEHCLEIDGLKIPLSVEFLGILDTVASVGSTHMLPFADGHMAWADDTMELPDNKIYGDFIKRCVHLVSSHEQRLCFPLDSIRSGNGKYPANSIEVIYPGMHSDIGGGYPPGDQGKSVEINDSQLLSQIILNDLYSEAFKAGAPLKVPAQFLNTSLINDDWRAMPLDVLILFDVNSSLIHRFNAWREVTLNLLNNESPNKQSATEFTPIRAPLCLEAAIEEQLAWITAWRINRYAQGKLITTPFYQRATDSEAMPDLREKAAIRRELNHGAVRARRKSATEYLSKEELKEFIQEPGVKDFDPDMAQTQLKEAAQEFAEDYRGAFRSQNSVMQALVDTSLKQTIFLLNTDDEPREFSKMKAEGEQRVKTLFPFADEMRNADEPSGMLRALFDDQIHDSRAWFLYATLGARELWGSYFRYRMIYFGDKCNKSLSPLVIAGDVVGVATLAGGVIFSLKRKSAIEKVAGLAGTVGLVSLEVEALDWITKQPLPLMPDAEQLRQFTQEPGAVVRQQKAVNAEQHLQWVKQTILSEWSESAVSKLA